MDDPAKLAELFREALSLKTIFGDDHWRWSRFQRAMVEKALLACEIALKDDDPSDEELGQIGWFFDHGPPTSWEHRWELLAHGAQHCAQLMSTACAMFFDLKVRQIAFDSIGDRSF
jgi:hypothetical protein